MDARSRPQRDQSTGARSPADAERIETEAPPGDERLRPTWREGDRRFLIELNATRLPRAAICALGSSLPRWRDCDDAEEITRLLAEHSVTRRHAAIALDLHRDSTQPSRPPLADNAPAEAGSSVPSPPITTCAERGYPPALLDLPLPPPVLFHRGALPDRIGIAIVGSRRADSYGREVGAYFARALAERGLPIISGFARGIDQTAHRGALAAAAGSTVAVLGCGLDVDYPTGSFDLAREIARRGTMLSEFPPDTGPMRQNFPIRNRIIAALAIGTLVVQATQRSGSLITARLALDLGRDVYAVPGRITDPLSSGTNRLIHDGAHPALSPDDILDTLPTTTRSQLVDPPLDTLGGAGEPRARAAASPDPPAPPALLAPILDHLAEEATPLDALAAATGTPIDRLLGQLLELEIGGWVERLPGPAVRRRSR